MITQFSPIRSGSTLLYNIIRELENNCIKQHKYTYNKNNNYIITIRHPYNSIISSCLRLNLEINNKNLINHINKYIKNGGSCIANNDLNKPNICILFYEKFNNNYDYIFDSLELFFNKKYKDEKKKNICKKFSIENVKKIISKYNNFEEYDRVTHLHGNHISKYNGETNYKEILNDEQIKILEDNKILQKIINKYYS